MRLRPAIAAVVLWAACAGIAQGATAYDAIIRGGTVYDGSGSPGRKADVAIRGDRIAAVGRLRAGAAKRVIDAAGLAVAPGFINMLSWATESLVADGRSMGDIRQGVTLELLGEGMTMGPLNAAMRERAQARMRKLGIDAQWTTQAQYMEFLERRGVSPNIASFVGATNVRLHALGAENRKATPAEIARMQALVREAMLDGAFGVSSALAYAPAAYADTDELIALARVAAEHGGIYISHIRDEGDGLIESVEETIAIARAAKVPAEIYHLKALGAPNWPTLDRVIGRIEAARAEGLRITADMYPYTASATGLDVVMPTWVQEGGMDAWIARLQDPAVRARLVEEMKNPYATGSNRLIAVGSPDNILILGVHNPALRPIVGQTLGEIARTRKTSVEDTIIDLVIEDHSRLQVAYFLMSEDTVRKVLAQPWVSFASDAESVAAEGTVLEERTHPRAYGTFARVLGKYVREEKVISVAQAIRRLAALPAATLGIQDRGRLEPGMYADIVVFDPAAIADRATFDDPHRYAVGVRDVFVNGTQVLADGEHTGAKPGKFIRGRGWQAPPTPAPDAAATSTVRTPHVRDVAAAFADFAGPDRPGCAVSAVRDRKVVTAEGFGLADLEGKQPITADTNFDAASLSKQFTAFAALYLERRGVLSLDDSVRKFVPELGEYAQPAKVRDLLYHTSGLRDFMSISRIQRPPFSGLLNDHAALQILTRQSAAERPAGTEYMYSNTGYFLLSLVVQRASGRSMQDLLDEIVFKPLGMHDSRIEGDVVAASPNVARSYMSSDGQYTPTGRSLVVSGATGLHTTVRDMARWSGNFWTDRAGGGKLMSRMMEVGALAGGKSIGYAGGLTRTRYRGLTVLRHGGSVDGFRHNYLVFPEQRFAVAVLCNRSDAAAAERAEAVADAYLAPLMTAKEIATEVTELAARTGRVDLPAMREGFYRDVKSGEYLALERKDADRWVLGYRGRELPLDQVSSQVYKTEPLQFRPIYLAFTPQSVLMAYAGDYDEFASITGWNPADPGRWVGTYHNEETGAQLRLTVQDGALTNELGTTKLKLRPGRVGEFIQGRGALVVPVDEPADWVALHMVGLRGLRFTRQEGATAQ